MFYALLVTLIVLTLLLFLSVNRSHKNPMSGSWFALGFGSGILIVITGCFFVSGTFGTPQAQLDDFQKIDQSNKRMSVIAVQRTAIEADIIAQLDRYPEIEKEIMNKPDPLLLVNYPDLKSNETITKAFDELNRMNSEKAELQKTISDTKTVIRMREYNPMTVKTPWLFRTYEDFFGKSLNAE